MKFCIVPTLASWAVSPGTSAARSIDRSAQRSRAGLTPQPSICARINQWFAFIATSNVADDQVIHRCGRSSSRFPVLENRSFLSHPPNARGHLVDYPGWGLTGNALSVDVVSFPHQLSGRAQQGEFYPHYWPKANRNMSSQEPCRGGFGETKSATKVPQIFA